MIAGVFGFFLSEVMDLHFLFVRHQFIMYTITVIQLCNVSNYFHVVKEEILTLRNTWHTERKDNGDAHTQLLYNFMDSVSQ